MLSCDPIRTVLIYDRNTGASDTTYSGVAYIDTLGYDACKILFWEESTGDTVAALVLQVEEGDTTSSYATFAGARGGTDFTAVAVVTQSQSSVPYHINVSCVGRKRYLRLKWKPGATNTTSTGVALLYRAHEAPISTTKANSSVLYSV